jgi:hypothetical protein
MKVYCADVGSVSNHRFAWARADSKQPDAEMEDGHDDIRELAERVAEDLSRGEAVALGFECPLFVPIPDDPIRLGKCRDGEGNRAWSASAGAGALATGLVQAVWVLRKVRELLPQAVPLFTDWKRFSAEQAGLYVWEAFVSGKGKAAGHERVNRHKEDAKAAVREFMIGLPDVEGANAIQCGTPVYSLIGAALLRTKWSTDLQLLAKPCIVIKAGQKAASREVGG